MNQLIDSLVHAARPYSDHRCSMPTLRVLAIVGALALLLAGSAGSEAVAGQATAAKKKPAVGRCPAGATPIVTKRRGKLVVKRDKRGRPRCLRLKRSRLQAPAATPSLQIGEIADMLGPVADINPMAFTKLNRAVGARRTERLLDLSLKAWRQKAGAASVFRAHDALSSTESFSSGGAEGKVSFGVEAVEGAQSGFTANASAELKVNRADLEKIMPSAKDKLPAEITGASAKVDVTFEDVTEKCPTDKGAVPGKLKGKGSITVKVERSDGPPIEVTLSAEVGATYTAQTGADGKVSAINNVEVKTVFQTGGSGQSTQTYRGRRVGGGFGREGILDAPSGKTAAAFERDVKHVDWNRGGDFGPRGSWSFERPLELSDLKSIDNIKAMIAARTATNLLTLAAVEYLRKVTLERIEKSPCGYSVFVDINSIGNFATHRAEGKLYFTVIARAVPGSTTHWTATAPATFTNLSFTSKIPPCEYTALVNTPGTFTIDLELAPSGSLNVKWSADPSSTVSVDCPPEGDPPYDPPPIPGQPGPSLLEATPTTFELPASGGLQVISGGVSDGASDGFFHSGSLLVSRTK